MRSIKSHKGLAAIKGPPESLIIFSCGFDQGTVDETQNERNGIFTEHLLNHITMPDQDVETILQNVARDIKLKGFPLPWRASCLTEKVYLAAESLEGKSIYS
ncbi:unnamed protein product [Rotaria sp. Silwood1]|nr:unnamed protein product [Rotaria sp. Silwood1]